jgi:glycosyltransferase involved in cell wall biosynthesis
MTLPRVCVVGAYQPDYPRNLILRRGLALHGVAVSEVNAPRELSTPGRMRAIARAFPSAAPGCDVILLAEFGQSLAPLAWWLARRFRKRLVVDAFTPLYDSAVGDRGVARPHSLSALRYRLIDWLSLKLADFVLTDTDQHAAYFAETYRVRRSKLCPVPVGASREWFEAEAAFGPTPAFAGDGLTVQFYGSYIPLHGVETILHAAARLRDRPDLHFELIGRGQTYPAMRSLADRLALPNVDFCDPVPPADLPALAARAAISLGIFGTTDKARRVVPNKVYQTLALGRAVVTASTPALRAAFTPGEHLLAVPPGDDAALADAITRLADDPALRARLGAAGRAHMSAEFDEAAVGRRLLDALPS